MYVLLGVSFLILAALVVAAIAVDLRQAEKTLSPLRDSRRIALRLLSATTDTAVVPQRDVSSYRSREQQFLEEAV